MEKMEISQADKRLFEDYLLLCKKDIDHLAKQLSKEIYVTPRPYEHLLGILAFGCVKHYIKFLQKLKNG